MPYLQTIRWISSPVETVFACIRNPHMYRYWLPHVRAVRWPLVGALAVGQIGVLHAGQRELRLRISAYVENHLLELERRDAGCLTRERIELEPAMGGTRVIHSTEMTVLVARDRPLQGRIPPTRKLFGDTINALKRALETDASRYTLSALLPQHSA